MHKLYDLKYKLIDEMEDYADRTNYSKEDVEAIKYMSSAVDHICNIIERCEEEEGYSNMSMRGNSYGMLYPNGGYSMRRTGRINSYANYSRAQKRDSMGRYSRADDFRSELEELIQEAPNDSIRQKMQSIMYEM